MRFGWCLTCLLMFNLVACGSTPSSPSTVAAQSPTSFARPATPSADIATEPTAAVTRSAAASRSAIPAPITTSVPSAEARATPTVGRLNKEGYWLIMDCYGEGTPTVVLDARAHGDAQTWNRGKVHLAIAEFTRVCRYTRPSIPPPLTSQQIAQDLHEVLQKTSIGPPYIVVGTELGGFTARVFTSQFPDEVAGLVLINAFHPDGHARFTAVIPPAQPNDSVSLQLLRENLAIDNELYRQHGTDYTASAAQARDTGPFGDLPLVVITPGKPSSVPEEVRADWERVRLELQAELTQLSTNSTQIIAEKSRDCVQCDEPQLVVEAIRSVVEAARNGTGLDAAK